MIVARTHIHSRDLSFVPCGNKLNHILAANFKTYLMTPNSSENMTNTLRAMHSKNGFHCPSSIRDSWFGQIWWENNKSFRHWEHEGTSLLLANESMTESGRGKDREWEHFDVAPYCRFLESVAWFDSWVSWIALSLSFFLPFGKRCIHCIVRSF